MLSVRINCEYISWLGKQNKVKNAVRHLALHLSLGPSNYRLQMKWNEMKMLSFNVIFSKHWNSSHTIIDTTFLRIHLKHKEFVVLTFIAIFWYHLTSLLLVSSFGVSKVYCSPSSRWFNGQKKYTTKTEIHWNKSKMKITQTLPPPSLIGIC